MKSLAEKLAGAVSIVEMLSRNDPVHERNASKRIFSEVTRAWPGEVRRLWWKWFSEVASSLEIRTKTLDCSIEEACYLAKNRSQIILFREDEESGAGEWLAVLGSGSRDRKVILAGEEVLAKRLTQRYLRTKLKLFATEGQIRCVIVQPQEHTVLPRSHQYSQYHPTPLERLWKLLQPETSDLWVVVVFAFVVALLMLATPIAVEALVNTVAFGQFFQPILVLALILLTFLGFQAAIRALKTYVVEIVQRRLFARVAGDLAYRLPRTELEACDGEYLPELVNRFFDIVTVQKVTAQLLLEGLGIVLSTLIGMVVLAFYHPWLLGFDLFLLFSIAMIIFVLGRGAVSTAVKESKQKYYMAAWLGDIARCRTVFRSDGGADLALERTDRLLHEYLNARSRHFRIVMRQVLFALGLQAIASTVLLGLGGWLVVSGELTLGQLVAAELIVTIIVGSFAKFGKHMESFYDLLASVDKLGVLFDLRMEHQEGMLEIKSELPARLDLNSVTFSWPEELPVLSSLTAHIEPGDRVAILGGAGTGKSTLFDLILGLRFPTAGHISIDEADPRDLRPDALRSRVALARGSEMFHSTIEENIHLHRAEITGADAREVLKELGLLDAVLKFREGCDTMLTSEGAPLSENQRRILGIARAAIGRPGLLLIDGVLDFLSDAELDQCLNYLTSPEQPWTLIVATTRRDLAERLGKTIELAQPGALSR